MGFVKDLVALVEKEGAGYDFATLSRRTAGPAHLVRRHGRAPDVAALTQWIDWAFAQAKAALAKAA